MSEVQTVVAVESDFVLSETKAVFLFSDEAGKFANIISTGKSPVLGLAEGITLTLDKPTFIDQIARLSAGTKLYFTDGKLTGYVVPPKAAERSSRGSSSGSATRCTKNFFDR